MNYIKQLNCFFDYLQRNSLTQSEQLLYHTLLMVNNSCGWLESFGRTNQSLAGLMGVSINTLLDARMKLQSRGLIKFKKGKKGDVTKYSIPKLYEEYGSKSEPQIKPYSELQTAPQTEPKTEPQTEHIINNKHKTKKDKKIFPPESIEMSLAAELKKLILKNNGNAKTPQCLNGWAYEFDKMIRLDNRPIDELSNVLAFSQSDTFWMSNILSASKLREKYDTLLLQSKNQRGGQAIQQRTVANPTPEQQKKKEFIRSLYV